MGVWVQGMKGRQKGRRDVGWGEGVVVRFGLFFYAEHS